MGYEALIPNSWKTPVFDAADFTADVGNWTVDSGDVVTDAYVVMGKTVTYTLALNTTTTSSTPVILTRALPDGMVVAKLIVNTSVRLIDNTGPVVFMPGIMYVGPGESTIHIVRIDNTAIPAITDNLSIQGTLTFEIL